MGGETMTDRPEWARLRGGSAEPGGAHAHSLTMTMATTYRSTVEFNDALLAVYIRDNWSAWLQLQPRRSDVWTSYLWLYPTPSPVYITVIRRGDELALSCDPEDALTDPILNGLFACLRDKLSQLQNHGIGASCAEALRRLTLFAGEQAKLALDLTAVLNHKEAQWAAEKGRILEKLAARGVSEAAAGAARDEEKETPAWSAESSVDIDYYYSVPSGDEAESGDEGAGVPLS